MGFSVSINITTNAWNIIKFMAMYVLLDTAVPVLLECIDKVVILRRFSRDGRVPIADFTKDRQARSGVRELITHFLRRYRKQSFLRRSPSSLKLRPILLFSIWVASIIGEYGSGSEPKITQVEVPRSFPGTEGFLQAMFSCVKVEQKYEDTLLQLSVRNGTMTTAGMKCSCSHTEELGCTMPVHIERMNASLIALSSDSTEFWSNGTVQVKKYYPPNTSTVYVLVQSRARCKICSSLNMDPTQDILFNVYGALDSDGKLKLPAMYAGKLSSGTLVGLAYGKKKAPTEEDTLDDLFVNSKKVAFLMGVSERPRWDSRSFDTTDLAGMLSEKEAGQQEFLEIERPPDFSAIWSAWWLRGRLNSSPNGTVTLNTSSTETATISLFGILSFSYVIIVFFVLLVYTMASSNWRPALKTNGFGNVEWLISALIAQQQLRGSSLRGVDDLGQFDLTVVKNDYDVPHVRAQHWLTSIPLASPTNDLDDIADKNVEKLRQRNSAEL